MGCVNSPLRIVPVLDVKSGQAVLARAGYRPHYRPVQSILHEGSDPIGLARAYRDQLGLHDLYLADLNALDGAAPAVTLFQTLAELGVTLWIDAGVSTVEDAVPLIAHGVSVVVAGLETVRGPSALREILAAGSGDRVAFSLDLRDGRPLIPTLGIWQSDEPRAIAEEAIDAGIRRIILLDLDRVGTGSGITTIPLVRQLHIDHPDLEILVGGGVAGPDDLHLLHQAGANAALVGSALHDGRITAAPGTDPQSST